MKKDDSAKRFVRTQDSEGGLGWGAAPRVRRGSGASPPCQDPCLACAGILRFCSLLLSHGAGVRTPHRVWGLAESLQRLREKLPFQLQGHMVLSQLLPLSCGLTHGHHNVPAFSVCLLSFRLPPLRTL